MTFVKGMRPTKGFTDKKHSLESRRKMSETRRENHPTKKLLNDLEKSRKNEKAGGVILFKNGKETLKYLKEEIKASHG